MTRRQQNSQPNVRLPTSNCIVRRVSQAHPSYRICATPTAERALEPRCRECTPDAFANGTTAFLRSRREHAQSQGTEPRACFGLHARREVCPRTSVRQSVCVWETAAAYRLLEPECSGRAAHCLSPMSRHLFARKRHWRMSAVRREAVARCICSAALQSAQQPSVDAGDAEDAICSVPAIECYVPVK